MSTIDEEDWYIDPETGIDLFEFERPAKPGSYSMLHLVMNLKRKDPPIERRAPGAIVEDARQAYGQVALELARKPEILVTKDNIDVEYLQSCLQNIKSRRKKYNPDDG